jgi:cation transport ATPase
MATQPAANGHGYLVALAGALIGDLLLGAVAATPYIYIGGGFGDLGVVVLFGTYLPQTRPYSIVLHIALWAGSAAGTWLALRQRAYPGAGRTAFNVILLHAIAFGAAVVIAILQFGNHPLTFYRPQAAVVVLVMLVSIPLAARGYVVWRGGGTAPAPAPSGAH